jgi:hypothetical protein
MNIYLALASAKYRLKKYFGTIKFRTDSLNVMMRRFFMTLLVEFEKRLQQKNNNQGWCKKGFVRSQRHIPGVWRAWRWVNGWSRYSVGSDSGRVISAPTCAGQRSSGFKYSRLPGSLDQFHAAPIAEHQLFPPEVRRFYWLNREYSPGPE